MKRSWTMLWFSAVMALLLAVTLITATYAWFTVNREVETDRITSHTATDTLELQISRTGGSAFTPGKGVDALGEPCGEVPLNPLGDGKVLMPVSTADLKTFVYNPYTEQGYAEVFYPTEDESMYYHDTVYLRAVGNGQPEGTLVSLYLDSTPIVSATEGELLTASRLGLTFNGADPVIFLLSEGTNQTPGNTILDGTQLAGNMVLTYDLENHKPIEKADPAIPLSQRQITDIPGEPLIDLVINQIYTVDIYFYLEGCDPDCLSERVEKDEAFLQLAFFGMLKQEGNQ